MWRRRERLSMLLMLDIDTWPFIVYLPPRGIKTSAASHSFPSVDPEIRNR
jgi:hypothetical protein